MKTQSDNEGPKLRAQEGPQREFGRCPADIAIYGGAAGGGKSWALVFEAGRNTHVPGYAGIIFRRTYKEIKGGGSIWDESQKIYPHLGGKPYDDKPPFWRFLHSGALIEFSHLQYDKDVNSHQGKQYAFVGFDELTHFTEYQFWYLVSRMRSTCGVKPYMRCATNPDPDSWVRRFIDWWIGGDGYPIPERAGKVRWLVRSGDEIMWFDSKEAASEQFPERKPLSVTFIPAKLDDNPELTAKDPGYLDRLLSLPLVEREQLLGGNWNIRPASGLYFRRSYFEVIDEPPAEGQFVEIVRAWDKAATKPNTQNPDPDWTVGVKYGRLKTGEFVVLHVERLRETPRGVEQAVMNTATSDGKGVSVVFWQDPGQAGKVDVDHFRSLLAHWDTSVVKASKDKVTYAGPVSSQAESGNIKIVRGSWNEPFLRALEAFPDPKSHDDDVDALSLAHRALDDSDLAFLKGISKW